MFSGFSRMLYVLFPFLKIKASWHFWPLAYIWPLADTRPVGLGCVHFPDTRQIFLEKSPKCICPFLFTWQQSSSLERKVSSSAWKGIPVRFVILHPFLAGWKSVREYNPNITAMCLRLAVWRIDNGCCYLIEQIHIKCCCESKADC